MQIYVAGDFSQLRRATAFQQMWPAALSAIFCTGLTMSFAMIPHKLGVALTTVFLQASKHRLLHPSPNFVHFKSKFPPLQTLLEKTEENKV